MWHDKWWDKAPVSDHISLTAVLHANLELNMMVYEMIDQETWRWPSSWKNDFPVTTTIPVPKLKPDSPDTTSWVTNKRVKVRFSVYRGWNDLRINAEVVPYYDMVWCLHCVPRHAFILWLAIKERPATLDKIVKWYPGKVVTCPLSILALTLITISSLLVTFIVKFGRQ